MELARREDMHPSASLIARSQVHEAGHPGLRVVKKCPRSRTTALGAGQQPGEQNTLWQRGLFLHPCPAQTCCVCFSYHGL